jgi:hypothetical protein
MRQPAYNTREQRQNDVRSHSPAVTDVVKGCDLCHDPGDLHSETQV